jgi:hypothetical protein
MVMIAATKKHKYEYLMSSIIVVHHQYIASLHLHALTGSVSLKSVVPRTESMVQRIILRSVEAAGALST